ncbi:MAG TPA: hypothetical protein VHJ34_02600 [Actinomycetota bacterium]|nr:hypothetical protein [Actinomycetota bacterium]
MAGDVPARRAWPFEGKPEAGLAQRYSSPADFVARGGEGTEAVVVRIGLNDAQLVLVAGDGRWERWVYHSVDDAEAVARDLGVPLHVGEYPEATRVRMNAYVRPAADFDVAAYPEQGDVGPVNPYPENRPRRIEATDRAGDGSDAGAPRA